MPETAFGLDLTEHVDGTLELAGESLAVHAEGGEGAVGVDDVEADGGLIGGWVGGAREQVGSSEGMRLSARRCRRVPG